MAKAESAREQQDQQKVLEFLQEWAKSGERGQCLVQQFKYYCENITLDKDGKRNFLGSTNFEIMETQDERWLKFDWKHAKHPDPTHSSVVILNG